jgi:dual specificity phosphatase 12
LNRKKALRDANITHIVSVLNLDLNSRYDVPGCERLRIDIQDDEEENILQYFKETNLFIEKGIASGGGVFVHW